MNKDSNFVQVLETRIDCEALTTTVVSEPGNGTRYTLVFARPDMEPTRLTGAVVTWLYDASRGRSMVVNPDSFLHSSYVSEKLGPCGDADARVITRLIGQVLGLETSEGCC